MTVGYGNGIKLFGLKMTCDGKDCTQLPRVEFWRGGSVWGRFCADCGVAEMRRALAEDYPREGR